jgi:AhpD family alkylhydroperoxidase
MGLDSLVIKRFYNIDTQTYRDGALSATVKELMGLSVSLALRCNDCVLYHIDAAAAAGATRAQIVEAMEVALVIGGSIVIPHMRVAVEALNERLPE